MRKRVNFSVTRLLSSLFAVFMATVLMCLLNIWQKNQIVKTGYQISDLRQKIAKMDELINRAELKIDTLKSPDKIFARLDNDFSITSSDRIVHVARIERTEQTQLSGSDEKYVAQHSVWEWMIASFLAHDAQPASLQSLQE